MAMSNNTLSRISKLFIDRDDLLLGEAEERRRAHRVSIVCGPELAKSSSMQAALLTAAATASRCFPDAVDVIAPGADQIPSLLGWKMSIAQALAEPEINVPLRAQRSEGATVIGIGSLGDLVPTVQATFDLWTGGVVTPGGRARLQERDANPLAGMLCGALAVSEIFLRFGRVQVEATKRDVGLSLWDPARDWDQPNGDEPHLVEVPEEFWLLGLGHLGQAYCLALSLLPFSDRKRVNLLLQDHDRSVRANIETGMLCHADVVGDFKARHVALWLEARGFSPRVVERRFDERTHVERGEPRLGLCGFDGGGPRHLLDLEAAGFERVVEAGLGGRADNFESMSIHSLPHSERTAAELWPVAGEPGGPSTRVQELAGKRREYSGVERKLGCGQVELAGRSVGVPFVGAVAASFVLSEALRMVHQGKRHDLVELRLGNPSGRTCRSVGPGYSGGGTPTLSAQPVYRQ